MLRFHRYFFVYIIVILYIGSIDGKYIISIFCVLLHEIAHYITARCFKFNGFDMEITPYGANINLKDIDNATPVEDFIISVSGPIFSILIGVIFFLFDLNYKNEYTDYLFKSNLVIGLFNLIPAFPLDGGRMLRDILSMKILYKRANEIMINTSIAIGYLIIILFFTLLFFEILIINLLIIGILILISSIKERKRFVYIILGDIYKKKSTFNEKKYIECKTISVSENEMLVRILSICDKNRYNIFYILNDNLEVVDNLFESELVYALKEKGNISIKEYLKNRV